MLDELVELLPEEFAPVDEPFEHHCPVCGCCWKFCRCTLDDLLDIKYAHEIEKEN